MNIVIIGSGKIGDSICEQLAREGHDVTLIDKTSDILGTTANQLDIMCVEGDGAMRSTLIEANAGGADLVIACTGSDETNMLSCLMAKKLGARRTAARVRNPEYYKQIDFIKNDLGIDVAINPELITAEEICRVFIFPAALKIEVFARGRAELVEFKIDEGSPLDGITLSALSHEVKVKALVCAVQRGEEVYIPKGDFRLLAGDRIHVSASHKDIEGFLRAIGGFREKVKTSMIVGGGRIGYYLAALLLSAGIHVKIIERDEAFCNVLAAALPEAAVINGDGTDQKLLFEEGIEHADSFAALTGIDEENMVISLFAQSSGVDKVVTKINRDSYIDMAGKMGIDSIVSPKDVTSSRMVSYARAMENTVGSSNVENMYKILGGSVEALEFIIRDSDAPYIGKPLKELRLKENSLIGCIVRNRKSIIPNGDTEIQLGDSVILVTTDSRFNDLKDAFNI